MPTAQMPIVPPKKNYSVKEAARLMGVSTNTLYKYLDEGSIKARRIGQGRFKIPAKELEGYLETGSMQNTDSSMKNVAGSMEGQNIMPVIENTNASVDDVESGQLAVDRGPREIPESNTEDIKSGVNDIIFFRIFKSVTFLGLAFIYFFSKSHLFSFDLSILNTANQSLLALLPFALMLSGIFNLLEVISPKRFAKGHLLFDVFSVVTLAIYSYLAITSAQWGIFVFAISFTSISVGHLISGARGQWVITGFFNTFSRYCLMLGIVGGIVIVMFPDSFPLQSASKYISTDKSIFTLLWFLFLTAPIVYILSKEGQKSPIKLPFFVLASSFAIIIAINLTFFANWDVSYFSFITGIFGFFTAWWVDEDRVLNASKIWLVVLAFAWVGATITFGLISLNISRTEIKTGVATALDESVVKVTKNINENFNDKAAVLTYFAGSLAVKELLATGGTQDAAIESARGIYDQLKGIERVMIYDKVGVAIGVYPRNSLFQGTDFSSQDYFSETQNSYRPQVSPLFENIVGEPVIIQTEPVFSNNEFVGMIGISYDLKNFTSFVEVATNYSYTIKGVDAKGFIVFSTNEAEVGGRDAGITLLTVDDYISSTQSADIPRWKIIMSSLVAPAVSRISNLNITLSILLTVNALFSIAAGIIAAKKKDASNIENEVNAEALSASSPRFI